MSEGEPVLIEGPAPVYHRILLKLSGDAFAPPAHEFGISEKATMLLATQLKDIRAMGVEVAIVVGGGNIWRGREAPGMDRAHADYMASLSELSASVFELLANREKHNNCELRQHADRG